MKKNFFSIFLLIIIAAMIFVSCGSTPEVEEEPVQGVGIIPPPTVPPPQQTVTPPQQEEAPTQEEVPPPQTVTPVQETPADLSEQIARAQAARQTAVDFDSPLYFPSDWERIEAQFNSAGSAEAYDAAADAYSAILGRTVPLYAQAREDEIIAERNILISTGLTPYAPEYLRRADDIALTALDQYEAGDYYSAKDTAAEALREYEALNLAAKVFFAREDLLNTGVTHYAQEYLDSADDIALAAIYEYDADNKEIAIAYAEEALDEYEALYLAARVFLAREEVINRGFIEYDADNFYRADDVALSAIDEYDAGNIEAAVEHAEEALLRYNIVLSNGWVAFASVRRESAIMERDNALAQRANIASRELFREGEASYSIAQENLAAGNYHDAALHYMDAEAIFIIARLDTEERRERALQTIRLAEERIEESNETAIEAERIIEGGIR